MNRHSFLARVYHTAGLSAKASDEVAQLATAREPMTTEDEATVSVVTKARLDQLRRIICAVEEHEENKGKANRVAALRQLKVRIEGSLAEILNQYIASIDSAFIARPTSEASRILFLKMKADYSRYLAEIQRVQPAAVQAAYVVAYGAALGAAHPIRTGIALNYSVFHYEIAQNRETAVEIAKAAHAEGMGAVKALQADEREDAMEVLNLIAANLKNWS
jgi:14-3-3 protein epsilon